MISVLVVGRGSSELSQLGSRRPSLEIVAAVGVEDALDRLARNRRLDAVLLLSDAATSELPAAIREEDPGSPPLYAPASAGTVPGATPLDGETPEELIESLLASLDSGAK